MKVIAVSAQVSYCLSSIMTSYLNPLSKYIAQFLKRNQQTIGTPIPLFIPYHIPYSAAKATLENDLPNYPKLESHFQIYVIFIFANWNWTIFPTTEYNVKRSKSEDEELEPMVSGPTQCE